MHEALEKLANFQKEINDTVLKENVSFSTVSEIILMTIDDRHYPAMTTKQFATAMKEIYRKANVIGLTSNAMIRELSQDKVEVHFLLTLLSCSTGAVRLIQNSVLECSRMAEKGWLFTRLVGTNVFESGIFTFESTAAARIKFPVNVNEVAPPSNIEEFRKAHVSTVYLHGDEPEAKTRMEKPNELMYARWDWAMQHCGDLVNALRVCGHTDSNIQAMCDGQRPLCFRDAKTHKEFLEDLKNLKVALEAEMGWKNVGFVQSGSSVPGFSTNPLKGLPYQASKITDPLKSDVDLVVVGEGVKDYIEANQTQGVKGRLFPSTGARLSNGKVEDEVRWGCKDDKHSPKALLEFRSKWTSIFGGGMQNTFALSPTPSLPPWETRLL